MNMIRLIVGILIFVTSVIFVNAGEFLRGVVYDVGLYYGGTDLSVKDFNPTQVKYDMSVISNILNCNAVRIEGEDVNRLATASEIAYEAGLKVFFNPWKMGADATTTVAYMSEAAQVAEKLRNKGGDVVFVAGCEYTLFSKGAFPGETFDERFNWLTSLWQNAASADEVFAKMAECNIRLNSILADVCEAVRAEFHGQITYSSGTWEQVDWNMFDIVGLDHYRRGESDSEYLAVVERMAGNKPVVVLETGCCAYEGAAKRGGEGFAVLQGVDSDGNGIYEGGVTPKRSENEQADYVEKQVRLLFDNEFADGVFVYVFSYPIYPFNSEGVDLDMVSYALVKSLKSSDPRSHRIPSWVPKEAFFRLGAIYTRIVNEERMK